MATLVNRARDAASRFTTDDPSRGVSAEVLEARQELNDARAELGYAPLQFETDDIPPHEAARQIQEDEVALTSPHSDKGELAPFEQGFNRGLHRAQANWGSALKAIGEEVGVDFIKEFGSRVEVSQLLAAAEYDGTPQGDFEDLSLMRDAGSWFLSSLGEVTGQNLPMAVTGASGAALATNLGKHLLNSVTQKSAKKILDHSSSLRRRMQNKGQTDSSKRTNWTAAEGELEGAIKGFNKHLKDAPKNLKKYKAAGAAAGMWAEDNLEHFGTFYRTQMEAGATHDDAIRRAATAAPVIAALDIIAPTAILGRLSKNVDLTPSSFKGVMKETVESAAQGATIEMPTEVIDTLTEEYLREQSEFESHQRKPIEWKEKHGERTPSKPDLFNPSEKAKKHARTALVLAGTTGGTLSGAPTGALGIAQFGYDKAVHGVNTLLAKMIGDPTKATFKPEQAEEVWRESFDNIREAVKGASEITDDEAAIIGYNALIALNAFRQRSFTEGEKQRYLEDVGKKGDKDAEANVRAMMVESFENQIEELMKPFAEQINVASGPERSIVMRRTRDKLLGLQEQMEDYADALKNAKTQEERIAILNEISSGTEGTLKSQTKKLTTSIKDLLGSKLAMLKRLKKNSMADDIEYRAYLDKLVGVDFASRYGRPSQDDEQLEESDYGIPRDPGMDPETLAIAMELAIRELEEGLSPKHLREIDLPSIRTAMEKINQGVEPSPEELQQFQNIKSLREPLEQAKAANRPQNVAPMMRDLFGDSPPKEIPLIYNIQEDEEGGHTTTLFPAELEHTEGGGYFWVTSPLLQENIATLEQKYPGHKFTPIETNESILVDRKGIDKARKKLEDLTNQRGAEGVSPTQLESEIRKAEEELRAIDTTYAEPTGSFEEGVEDIRTISDPDSDERAGIGHVILAEPIMVLRTEGDIKAKQLPTTLSKEEWAELDREQRSKYKEQSFDITQELDRVVESSELHDDIEVSAPDTKDFKFGEEMYNPLRITDLGLKMLAEDGHPHLIREGRKVDSRNAYLGFMTGLQALGIHKGFSLSDVITPLNEDYEAVQGGKEKLINESTADKTSLDNLIIFNFDGNLNRVLDFGTARTSVIEKDREQQKALDRRFTMLSDEELERQIRDSALYVHVEGREDIEDMKHALLQRYREEHAYLEGVGLDFQLHELLSSEMFSDKKDIPFIEGLRVSLRNWNAENTEDIPADLKSPIPKYSEPINTDIYEIHKFIKGKYLQFFGYQSETELTTYDFIQWKKTALQNSISAKQGLVDLITAHNNGQPLDIRNADQVFAFTNIMESESALELSIHSMLRDFALGEYAHIRLGNVVSLLQKVEEREDLKDSNAATLLKLYSAELVQSSIETLDLSADTLLNYYAGILRSQYLSDRVTQLSDPEDSSQNKGVENAASQARGEGDIHHISGDVAMSVGRTAIELIRDQIINTEPIEYLPDGTKVVEYPASTVRKTTVLDSLEVLNQQIAKAKEDIAFLEKQVALQSKTVGEGRRDPAATKYLLRLENARQELAELTSEATLKVLQEKSTVESKLVGQETTLGKPVSILTDGAVLRKPADIITTIKEQLEKLKSSTLPPVLISDPLKVYNSTEAAFGKSPKEVPQDNHPLYPLRKAISKAIAEAKLVQYIYNQDKVEIESTYKAMIQAVELGQQDRLNKLNQKLQEQRKAASETRNMYIKSLIEARARQDSMIAIQETILSMEAANLYHFADIAQKAMALPSDKDGSAVSRGRVGIVNAAIEQGIDEWTARFVADILLDPTAFADPAKSQTDFSARIQRMIEKNEASGPEGIRPQTYYRLSERERIEQDISMHFVKLKALRSQFDQLSEKMKETSTINDSIRGVIAEIDYLDALNKKLKTAEDIRAVNASSGLGGDTASVTPQTDISNESFTNEQGIAVPYDVFLSKLWNIPNPSTSGKQDPITWDELRKSVQLLRDRLSTSIASGVSQIYGIKHRPFGNKNGIALIDKNSTESSRMAALIEMVVGKLKTGARTHGFNVIVVDANGLEALIDDANISELRQPTFTNKKKTGFSGPVKAQLDKLIKDQNIARGRKQKAKVNAIQQEIEKVLLEAGELTYKHGMYTETQLHELRDALKSTDKGRTIYMEDHAVIYVDTKDRKTWQNTMTAAHEVGHAVSRAMLSALATKHIEFLKAAYIEEIGSLDISAAEHISFPEWWADKFAGFLVGSGILDIPTTFPSDLLNSGVSPSIQKDLILEMREITESLAGIHSQALDLTNRLYNTQPTLQDFLTILLSKDESLEGVYQNDNIVTEVVNFKPADPLNTTDDRVKLIHSLEANVSVQEYIGVEKVTPAETHKNEKAAEEAANEQDLHENPFDIIIRLLGGVDGDTRSVEATAAVAAMRRNANDLGVKFRNLTSPIMAAVVQLDNLGLPPEVVNLFWQPAQTRVNKEAGLYKKAWFNSTTVQEGRWGQIFADVFPVGDKVAKNQAILDMQDERIEYSALSPEAKKLRDVWGSLLDFLREADPTLDISEGKMARIWNTPRIESEREEWFQFLRDNGVSTNDQQLTRLTNSIIDSEKITKIEGIVPPSSGPIVYHDMLLDKLDTSILQEAGWLHSDPETVLLSSVHKAIRAAEFGKIFGEVIDDPNGRFRYFDPAAKLKRAVQNLDSESDKNRAEVIIQGILGQRGAHMSKKLRGIQNGTLAYMNTLMLLFSGVAQITELGGAVLRSKDMQGVGAALHSYVSTAANPKEMQDRYRAMGFLEEILVEQSIAMMYGMEGTSSWATSLNKNFFKFNGLKFMMDLSRVLSAKTGEDFILRHAGRATDTKKATTEERAESIRYLEELGLSVSDVNNWDNAGRPIMNRDSNLNINLSQSAADQILAERIQHGLRMFIDQSLVHPNNAIRPVLFSDARFNALTHLKTFFYGYQHTVLAGIWNNARERKGAQKLVPMLIAGMMIMPLAALSLSLRERIKYGGGKTPTDDMDFMEYTHELFTRGGGYGMFEPIVASYHARYYNGITWGMVPVVNKLGQTTGYIWDGDVDKALISLTPGVSQVNQLRNQLTNH
jgi:hypothetical protein